MRLRHIVSFMLGMLFGCLVWHFGSEILNRPKDHELTPKEEVERMLDCLGIGD